MSETVANPAQARETTARGARRRSQILDAAVALFGEQGYRGTSLRDIAHRVGITHPGLLYHFHSKEELLQDVLRRRDQLNHEAFLTDVDSPRTTLQRYLSLVEHNQGVPGMVELFATLSAEAVDPQHPAHDYFRERYADISRSHEALFIQLAERGELAPGIVPRQAGHALTAMMDGLQVQWLYDNSLSMADELLHFVNNLLVEPL